MQQKQNWTAQLKFQVHRLQLFKMYFVLRNLAILAIKHHHLSRVKKNARLKGLALVIDSRYTFFSAKPWFICSTG